MDDELRAFLSSPTAFRVEVDDEPHVVRCRSCLSAIVFELGMMPSDGPLTITPLHDWAAIGAKECEGCGEAYF